MDGVTVIRTLLLALVVLFTGCFSRPWIWDVWPVTPAIAAKSTHALSGLASDGVRVEAAAFVVDGSRLVTSASICMTSNVDSLILDVGGAQRPAKIEQLFNGLCLIRVDHAPLGNAMIIARFRPRKMPPHATRAGSPVFDGCGVIGVVGAHGNVVSLRVLHRFLRSAGVRYELEPDPPTDIAIGMYSDSRDKERDREDIDARPVERNYGRGGCR